MIFKATMKGALAALATVSMLALPGGARADYPEKPIEMTILFGGTANTIAQLLAELMSQELPEPVVPVSRPGGGGAVGYSHVAAARPDGYQLVWNSNSINTVTHTGRVPFDYTAFAPIARISVETPALGVNSDRGWASLDDLKAAAMAGKPLKVGISGKGSFTHLVSAALFDAMGIADKVMYISYGDGKAPVELMAGRIDAAIQWPGQFSSYMQSGELKVLAVTGAERIEALPDVPTAAEQGVDVDITMWRGLAAPAGTPDDVIAALAKAAQAATQTEQFKAATGTLGFTAAYMGPEQFGALIKQDDEFYGALLGELGMGM
ncbi:tripartite tricarboxylate transporter substrate binding protein [Salipiger sp. 1_MG-2023]|uniref:Bug family tripartite tricarboxylate transporter substrate binding protein n=1 Tax=Salipiger sp. 1_MG-2023 TaxID=3062665 RepID=UPI0026E12893|nr:tripartite tricarboxylate transporter substrate binding protein [Salipiger sp. 1_MG-2023]MDO6588418.1 tripartite tricarboxylate transporter substrate binding protein [Salipiger sp. 1_MG-2023]